MMCQAVYCLSMECRGHAKPCTARMMIVRVAVVMVLTLTPLCHALLIVRGHRTGCYTLRGYVDAAYVLLLQQLISNVYIVSSHN